MEMPVPMAMELMGKKGDEHRGRSRSRGRAATEAHGSPGLKRMVVQE